MRKVKKMLTVLLSSLVLLTSAIPVSASEKDLPFTYKEPSSDVKLFSKDSFNYDYDDEGNIIGLDYISGEGNNYELDLFCDSDFKIITYNSDTKSYYSVTEKEVTVDANNGYYEFGTKKHDSVKSALDASEVYTGGDTIATLNSPSSYILFFKENATSLKDLVYAVKFSDIFNHLDVYNVKKTDSGYTGSDGDDYVEDIESDDDTESNLNKSNDKISVKLVKKIRTKDGSVTGGKFNISYDLSSSGSTPVSLGITGYEDRDITSAKLKNTIPITLDGIDNGVYTFTIYTNNESCDDISCDYIVNFCKSGSVSSRKGKGITPKVTFSGKPKGTVALGNTVIMKMNTNVETVMRFNGDTLGGGKYSKSCELKITANGIYNYDVISEDGKVTKGILRVDFFKSPLDLSKDPINLALANSNSYNDTTTGLVQTGLGNTTLIIIIGSILIISGVVLLVLKGGKKNEK